MTKWCKEHAEKTYDCYPLFCHGCNSCVQQVYEYVRQGKRKDGDMMSLNDIKVTFDGRTYQASAATLNETCDAWPRLEVDVYLDPRYRCDNSPETPLAITNVIFNPPATIVFWNDNTKTVVRCDESLEDYDPEKGIAMAISRKMLADNKREYYHVFKHWLKKWDKQKAMREDMDTFINKMFYGEEESLNEHHD